MRAGTWIARGVKRILGEERGFTLIELMSAMIVTTLGVAALVTTLDSSRELITFSETKETAVSIGEQELERLVSLGYDKLELKDDPSPCNAFPEPCDQNNPGYYVKDAAWYRFDQRPWGEQCAPGGSPREKCEDLVIDKTTAEIPPDPIGVVENQRQTIPIAGPNGTRLQVQIQRFVTWVDDDCVTVNPPPVPGACTGAHDYKRVTVAVRVLKVISGGAKREQLINGGPGRPILLSTVVRPPRETP